MNKYFKVPVYVLALLLVCAVHTAGAVTVSVSDAHGNYGTTVDVPINVSGTSNIGATDISLTYNPAVISPTGVVTNGTLISATDLIANYTGTSGIVNISVASLSGITGTGSIAIVQFQVIGSAGATSSLTLSRADAYDLDSPIIVDGNVTGYAELTVASTSSTFTITGEDPSTGDINNDGNVAMSDAVYLAKHVVGLEGYETIYADGDINNDGNVAMSDAVYLAKHVVGLAGYETIYG